ncbi:MAG: glycosyltransferase [Acidimicrobiales bacterium]
MAPTDHNGETSRPTVGLLVTTHRCGPFIDQTLASVAGQTHPPDQVVVVDDASDDDSVQRARAWSSHLNIDVIVRDRNGGVARARNAGLRRLDTDVVALLDGDDVLLPDHLAVMSDLYRRHGGIVSPKAQFWSPGSPPRPYQRRLRGLVAPKEDQLRRLIRRNFVFIASMVSRSDLDAVGGFTEGDRAQDTTADWDLWLRLVSKGAKVTSGPYPTVLYRVVPGSMSDDAATMLRCEITQLRRARRFLPGSVEPVVNKAVLQLEADLALLVEVGNSRTEQARRAIALHGGDWRSRTRALTSAAAPGMASRLLRRRGTW